MLNNLHYFFYFVHQSNNLIGNVHLHASSPLPEPIGKGRSSSTSSSITSDSGFYQRAPGSEREDSQMVSVSRNLDDTSHRHLMFLMASHLSLPNSVLLTDLLIINYLQRSTGTHWFFCWFNENFTIYFSADLVGILQIIRWRFCCIQFIILQVCFIVLHFLDLVYS